MWADDGYDARQVKAAVARLPLLQMEMSAAATTQGASRSNHGDGVVERTFSWLGRNRRLAKDYENLAITIAAFIAIASIRLALKRLARPA